MKAILSATLVLGFCGLAGAHGNKADPVGTWKCEYEIAGMKLSSTLMIKKDGDKLAGTMSWPDRSEGSYPCRCQPREGSNQATEGWQSRRGNRSLRLCIQAQKGSRYAQTHDH
jgi:hypothetical protein